MITDRKIKYVREIFPLILESESDFAKGLYYGQALGMMHAWALDGTISFAQQETLRAELNIVMNYKA